VGAYRLPHWGKRYAGLNEGGGASATLNNNRHVACRRPLSRSRCLDAPLVTVECHAGNGLPKFIWGPDGNRGQEARDRVRAALRNSNFDFPPCKVTDRSESERLFYAQQVEAVLLRSEGRAILSADGWG
jgi:hypothetical protein